MSEQVQPGSLEERRLAFEERKWADEFSLRQAEQQAKAQENSWRAKLFSPLMATILVGIVTVAGSVTATLLQNATSLRLERSKYLTTKEIEEEKFSFTKTLETQKQQHELILKMISVDNIEQARSNLQFLAETKLLADEALAKRLTDAAEKGTPLIRPPGTIPPGTALRECLLKRTERKSALIKLMEAPSEAGFAALLFGASPEAAGVLYRKAVEQGVCP